jgi:hypothetical protein
LIVAERVGVELWRILEILQLAEITLPRMLGMPEMPSTLARCCTLVPAGLCGPQ